MDYPLGRKGWFPAAARFAEAVSHTSNFPSAYLYGLFLALSGHIIGRNAYIRYATPLYPNSYLCLVGPSAFTHKSTAVSLALESLGDTINEMPPVTSLVTSQGLLTAMLNQGGYAFVVLDELANLLTRKRQDYAADLLARIVELYSCPRTAGSYTRIKPIEVNNCYVTFICNSTVEWLRSSLTATDLMAGFGNRMTFVLGDPGPIKPWPRTPFWADIGWKRIRGFDRQIKRDDDAEQVWNRFYAAFDRRQHEATPFVRTMAERIPEKALKAAIVICAWQGTHILDAAIMEAATDWGDYLYDSILRLAPAFEAQDRRVLEAVRGGATTRSALFDALSHDIPVTRIREAIDNLRWLRLLSEQDDHFQVLDNR